MNDRRLLKSNGRVAHVSLKGAVDADAFVEGNTMAIGIGLVPILDTPDGTRERELLTGEGFRVLEMPDDVTNGHAFGFAERDGYCGYVKAGFLHPVRPATHRVAARETYRKETADLKRFERTYPIYFGSRLAVVEVAGDWSGIDLHLGEPDPERASRYYVPSAHLAPITDVETDPVDVARRFFGTPYLWGGNSGRGIDCSGLIQAAMLACGWACPGDSDLQEAMPGERLTEADRLEPGDLIFWKGHVAMATGSETMIHANAHHMMVVEERIGPALQRIAANGTGPVKSRLRPERRPMPTS